ncbi:MAG: polysaccharide deacetylase family protein [Methylocystaceae bacterium]
MRFKYLNRPLLILIAAVILMVASRLTPAAKPISHDILYRDRVVVLLYHDFKSLENGTAISAQRLDSHFRQLEAHGFNVVSLDQAAGLVTGKNKVPVNAIAITMDDGYASNYTVAYPRLKERGWPATIFLTVSNVGRKEGKRAHSRWLTWEQILEMHKNDISFGAHTYNGHFFTTDAEDRQLPWLLAKLPAETEQAYMQRINADFYQSQAILENKLGGQPRHFAAPFGMYNDMIAGIAGRNGYVYCWSTEHLPIKNQASLSKMGRISVGIRGTTGEQLIKMILATAQSDQ